VQFPQVDGMSGMTLSAPIQHQHHDASFVICFHNRCWHMSNFRSGRGANTNGLPEEPRILEVTKDVSLQPRNA
jgi:hypothetical protein